MRMDASTSRPQVVINEIMARNTATYADEQNEFDDWIELFNAGPSDVNLQGFFITDDPLQPQRHTFGSIVVPAGGYVVIFADGTPEQGATHLPFRLSGDGETVTLRHPDGSTLDEVTFGLQEDDVSFGRFPNGTGALVRMTIPTPGMANTSEQRDAGMIRDAAVPVDASERPDASYPTAMGVVINEVLASNVAGLVDEAMEHEDWIELYNTSSVEQDLSFHQLSDTPGLPLWSFPSGTTIAANGFLVVFADAQPEQGPLHAGFRLSTSGEAVVLFAPDGTTLDSMTFGPQSADVSEARIPDGTGAFRAAAPTTPGARNGSPDAGEQGDAG